MVTIKEYNKHHPEMVVLLRWMVETKLNIEGLIGKLTEPKIVEYLDRGTIAIKADFVEAQVKMEKAIEHTKIAIERAEADIVIRRRFGGKPGGNKWNQ